MNNNLLKPKRVKLDQNKIDRITEEDILSQAVTPIEEKVLKEIDRIVGEAVVDEVIDIGTKRGLGEILVDRGRILRFLEMYCRIYLHGDDYVQVVRCKKCVWYREDEGICTNARCSKSYYGCRVPEQHFCSYGERRSNNETD